MDEVRRLTVKQFRIFSADVIPVEVLWSARGVKLLTEPFEFQSGRLDEETAELVLGAGAFRREGDDPTPLRVSELRIGERRVVLEVDGSSVDCTAVFQMLATLLTEADPFRRLEDNPPILLTQETSCSVRLDFDWRKLLNPRLSGFVEQEAASVLSTDKLHSRIKQMSLRFLFSITSDDEDAQDLVTLSDKQLVIEPRQGAPLSARRYFAHSPTDSETHLKLLRMLEARLTDDQSEFPSSQNA